MGKRADADETSNYDDDGDFYSNNINNNYDKADLNLENWNDGGYMDNKNDIDVIDYGLYPKGISYLYNNQIFFIHSFIKS